MVSTTDCTDNPDRKKILVTGGLGFIGSNFIRHILDKYPDYRIINLDIVSYCANFENLRDIEENPRYKFIKGDICDAQIVEKAIEDCDVVVNFAAESHVDRSILGQSPLLKQIFMEPIPFWKLPENIK